ncbi:MAG: hypothetical protein H6728_08890 [Myxococcales bacterium]|nr:hypothetical protein [Myxococcales bacterium]
MNSNFPPTERVTPRSHGVQSALKAPETKGLSKQEWEELGRKFGWIPALAMLLLFVWWLTYEAPLRPVGRLPQPIQKGLPKPLQLPAPPGYQFSTRYSYDITALILSRTRYTSDAESALSPVDFALGWGVIPMKRNLSTIKWSQWGRWYTAYPQSKNSPSNTVISRNSANTHIVPATNDAPLRKKLMGFRRGDLVRLKGYLLVARSSTTGWRWFSSITRDDTGGGACEVMYVTEAEKLDPRTFSGQ